MGCFLPYRLQHIFYNNDRSSELSSESPREGAAVRFDWDLKEFTEWQKKTIAYEAIDSEALAKVLVKDPPFVTRLQSSQKYTNLIPSLLPEGVDSITAVPVYGTRER